MGPAIWGRKRGLVWGEINLMLRDGGMPRQPVDVGPGPFGELEFRSGEVGR